MKYPAKQLAILQSSIKTLSKHLDIVIMHPSNLHYLVYQQGSEGQKHNRIYVSESGDLARFHAIKDISGWKQVLDVPSTFDLYPDGCNDSHIETAVKFCLKSLTE